MYFINVFYIFLKRNSDPLDSIADKFQLIFCPPILFLTSNPSLTIIFLLYSVVFTPRIGFGNTHQTVFFFFFKNLHYIHTLKIHSVCPGVCRILYYRFDDSISHNFVVKIL